jgi:hypothetical protein
MSEIQDETGAVLPPGHSPGLSIHRRGKKINDRSAAHGFRLDQEDGTIAGRRTGSAV